MAYMQRHIWNPVKQRRWSPLQKQLTTECNVVSYFALDGSSKQTRAIGPKVVQR